jgi:hypothetical protein
MNPTLASQLGLISAGVAGVAGLAAALAASVPPDRNLNIVDTRPNTGVTVAQPAPNAPVDVPALPGFAGYPYLGGRSNKRTRLFP